MLVAAVTIDRTVAAENLRELINFELAKDL
jgi:hypothetical protein